MKTDNQGSASNFQGNLESFAKAETLEVDANGRLISKVMPDRQDNATQRLIELKVMDFLIDNKDKFNSKNFALVTTIAAKAGLTLNNSLSARNHPFLIRVVNMIADQVIHQHVHERKEFDELRNGYIKRFSQLLPPDATIVQTTDGNETIDKQTVNPPTAENNVLSDTTIVDSRPKFPLLNVSKIKNVALATLGILAVGTAAYLGYQALSSMDLSFYNPFSSNVTDLTHVVEQSINDTPPPIRGPVCYPENVTSVTDLTKMVEQYIHNTPPSIPDNNYTPPPIPGPVYHPENNTLEASTETASVSTGVKAVFLTGALIMGAAIRQLCFKRAGNKLNAPPIAANLNGFERIEARNKPEVLPAQGQQQGRDDGPSAEDLAGLRSNLNLQMAESYKLLYEIQQRDLLRAQEPSHNAERMTERTQPKRMLNEGEFKAQKKELQAALKRLDEAQRRAKQFEQKSKQLESLWNVEQSLVQEIQAENEELQRQLTQKKIESGTRHKAKAQERLVNAEKRLEEIQSQLTLKEIKYGTRKKELTDLQQMFASTGNQLDEAKRQIEQLIQDIKEYQRETEKQEMMIDGQTQENRELRQCIVDQQQEVDEREEEINLLAELIESVRNHNDEVMDQFKDTSEQLAWAQNKIKKLEEETQSQELLIEGCENDLGIQKEYIAALEDEVELMTQYLQAQQEVIETHNADIQKMADALQVLISRGQQMINDLRHQSKTKDDQPGSRNESMGLPRLNPVDDIEKLADAMKTMIMRGQNIIDNLDHQTKTLTDEIIYLQDKNELLEIRLERSEEKGEQLGKVLARLELEVEARDEEIVQLDERHNREYIKYEREIDTLTSEVNQLRNQLRLSSVIIDPSNQGRAANVELPDSHSETNDEISKKTSLMPNQLIVSREQIARAREKMRYNAAMQDLDSLLGECTIPPVSETGELN